MTRTLEQVVAKKERNQTIDVMRFIYIMIVVFFHFYEMTNEHFVLGGTATNMFLVISGLFLFEHLEKVSNSNIYIYICKRYKRFFAYTATATFLMYVSNAVWLACFNHMGWAGFSGDISLSELALDIFSIGTQRVIQGTFPYLPTEWTISAILIVECMIYVLWTSVSKTARNMIVPVLVLFSLFPLVNGAKHIMIFQATNAICLGYLALKGSKKIKKLDLNWKGRALFTAFEIICNLIVICVLTFAQNPNFNLLCLPIFVMIVSIAYSGVSYIEQFIRKMKVTKYCGEYSLGIYLTHWIPHIIFLRIYIDPYERYSHKFIFLLSVLALGAVYCILVRLIIKFSERIKKICEKTLINEKVEEKA